MVGIGRVYEMYRERIIERDDEVAVLTDADTGMALTVPPVNVRFAVESLLLTESIDAKIAALIVSTASMLHFSERTYSHFLRKAGVAESASKVLRRALEGIHLKREDAQTLLERLPALSSAPATEFTAELRRPEDVPDDNALAS